MVVYKASFPNGKSYIGITSRKFQHRKNAHKSEANGTRSNMLFHKAIRKYGYDVIVWEIIFETNDYALLLQKEQELIKEHNTQLPNGYNITIGGSGCRGFSNPWQSRKRSLVSREKMRIAKKRFMKSTILLDTTTGIQHSFNSIREASIKLNLNYKSLSNAKRLKKNQYLHFKILNEV